MRLMKNGNMVDPTFWEQCAEDTKSAFTFSLRPSAVARFDRAALAQRRELIHLVSDCSRVLDDKKGFFIIKKKILLLCAAFYLPTSAPTSPLRRSVSRFLWLQVDDDTGGSAAQPLLSVIQLRKRCGSGEMWDTNTCTQT